ncbi:MAG: adenine deaminase [Bacteroidales bacterium]|nr:adenine deaminase [Bacteroidales bacterium]
MKKISGNIVDVVNDEIYQGTIFIENNKISDIKIGKTDCKNYILPGLIDAHVHVESSMLIPSEFARLAVTHGTVASVSDPHEIANVLGIDGVKYMIDNGKKVPFKFFFGAPSCVPATPFETSGAILGPDEIEKLLKLDDIKYLAEMMNFPGVLFKDENVIKKINIAKKYNKVVDGHAPGLKGEDAAKYAAAGISTDHECFTIEEALDKIKAGMLIEIREGSAAKNFEALVDLIKDYPDKIMFCSDDKHPNDLVKGHINSLIKRSINKGFDPLTVIKICTYNPVKHYNLEVGLLQKNDFADFIIVDDLKNFNVLKTYINGEKVAENNISLIDSVNESTPNLFNASEISEDDIQIKAESDTAKVIKAFDGQLITEEIDIKPKVVNNYIQCDTDNDILKIVVMNRYSKAKPSVALINNFSLKKGAIASTVAHDSHNIIAVGTSDKDIVKAINILVKNKGGISLVNDNEEISLPLPVAGIMSNKDAYYIAEKYEDIDRKAKELGTKLSAPYMTLSFMALLVIPELKLSDKGLFDGKKFEFTSVC